MKTNFKRRHCMFKRIFDSISYLLEALVCQGRNMVYPGHIDPYFRAVSLIPEPHFPPNFDP